MGTPHEITYHEVGCLPKDNMIALVETMVAEQQKQYCEPEKAPRERLRYVQFGGSTDSETGKHNCLTWLQAHLKHYSNLEFPPTPFTTRFFTDPKTIISNTNDCTVLDMKDWDRDKDLNHTAAVTTNSTR